MSQHVNKKCKRVTQHCGKLMFLYSLLLAISRNTRNCASHSEKSISQELNEEETLSKKDAILSFFFFTNW